MATIGQILGHHPLPDDGVSELLPNVGAIGLELELEGVVGNWPQVMGWRQEADHSLRDGLEYVFQRPYAGQSAVDCMRSMAEALQEVPPSPTFRCSTHIHMDVRDLDFRRLELLTLAYIMMEGVMFDHCSPERRYSNFCTPFFVNNPLARQFTQALGPAGADENATFHQLGAWPKYSAFNLKPVTNYGSVEFRGSQALTTFEELLALSQRMLNLKRVAVEFDGNPFEFIQHISQLGVDGVFQTGLREGYVCNEAVLDQGHSTALGIASRQLVSLRARARPRVMEAPREPFQDGWIRMNQDQMDAYNLFPVERLRLSDYLRMVRALRQMNHPNPPTIWTFVDRRSYSMFGSAQNFESALATLRIRLEDLGLL